MEGRACGQLPRCHPACMRRRHSSALPCVRGAAGESAHAFRASTRLKEAGGCMCICAHVCAYPRAPTHMSTVRVITITIPFPLFFARRLGANPEAVEFCPLILYMLPCPVRSRLAMRPCARGPMAYANVHGSGKRRTAKKNSINLRLMIFRSATQKRR